MATPTPSLVAPSMAVLPMWLKAAEVAASAVKAAAAAARASGDVQEAAVLVASAEACRAVTFAMMAKLQVDEELESRVLAARKCIAAQLHASRAGHGSLRPRDVLPGDDVALRNVAVHNFRDQVHGLSGCEAKRRQRRGRARRGKTVADCVDAPAAFKSDFSSSGNDTAATSTASFGDPSAVLAADNNDNVKNDDDEVVEVPAAAVASAVAAPAALASAAPSAVQKAVAFFEGRVGEEGLSIRLAAPRSRAKPKERSAAATEIWRLLTANDLDLPSECIHGTPFKRWPRVLERGYSTDKKGFVHFSTNQLSKHSNEPATGLAANSTSSLAVYFDLRQALLDGMEVLHTDNVLRARGFGGVVPPTYFVKVVQIETSHVVWQRPVVVSEIVAVDIASTIAELPSVNSASAASSVGGGPRSSVAGKAPRGRDALTTQASSGVTDWDKFVIAYERHR